MVARIKVEKKQTNFTIVPNEILQSKDLSLQAKGLIAQCLSFPDNWNYSINGLVAVVKEGKTAVMNTIKELERHGYVKRNRIHDENGKFAGIEYVITDYPNLDKPHTENLNMVKTQVNQPYAGKPNMVKPNTDKPISENQPQNNTIYKKENNINNNIVLDINIINDYIDKNNLKFVNAREFYNYYSQRGWKTNADEPITNWQALLVNWNNRNKIRIEEERERQRKINERHSYAVDSHNVPQSVPLEVPEFSPEQANSFLSRLASNGKQSNVIQSLIQSVVQGKEIK
ncbi:helix-turn-helix domain-containing protein [Megamonas funiformis]|uniref:helix-turn-helix domain-containing protein n=1 Tax=Megamonas funiformis TaxID=437897 RepID=UPI0022E234F5|nr:helix-turn-helix domain-containing protein [Megamonas funiformis]